MISPPEAAATPRLGAAEGLGPLQAGGGAGGGAHGFASWQAAWVGADELSVLLLVNTRGIQMTVGRVSMLLTSPYPGPSPSRRSCGSGTAAGSGCRRARRRRAPSCCVACSPRTARAGWRRSTHPCSSAPWRWRATSGDTWNTWRGGGVHEGASCVCVCRSRNVAPQQRGMLAGWCVHAPGRLSPKAAASRCAAICRSARCPVPNRLLSPCLNSPSAAHHLCAASVSRCATTCRSVGWWW